jgi:hypothetical protein
LLLEVALELLERDVIFAVHGLLQDLLVVGVEPRSWTALSPFFGRHRARQAKAPNPILKGAMTDLEALGDLLVGAFVAEEGIDGSLAEGIGERGRHRPLFTRSQTGLQTALGPLACWPPGANPFLGPPAYPPPLRRALLEAPCTPVGSVWWPF